jgi:hypothetical protein
VNYLPPTAHCEEVAPKRGCPRLPRLMEFYPDKYYEAEWTPEEWKLECLKLFYAMEQEKIKVMQAENRFQNAVQQIKTLAREATLNAGVDQARVAQILRSQGLV